MSITRMEAWLSDGAGAKSVVVYFSCMGNMDKDTDLDAISTASINLVNGE